MKNLSIKTIIILILSLVGLLVASDLVYIYIKSNFLVGAMPSFCSINEFVDCDGVARTKFSAFLGVPLAIWGVILYFLFIFLSLVNLLKEKFPNKIFDVFKNPYSYIFTIGLFSFCVSILLATISITTIHKICILCFVTYFLNLFIAICAIWGGNFFGFIKDTFVDFIGGVKKYPILFAIVLSISVILISYLTTTNVLAPSVQYEKKVREFESFKINKYRTDGDFLGIKGSDVKIYIYSDLRCPFCRITNSMLNKLAKMYKKVEIHHVNYPLDAECNPYIQYSMHEGACELARIAIAAHKQNNYWGMVNELFERDEINMTDISQKLGLDVKKLEQDAHSAETSKILKSEIELAHSNDINVTPVIVINDIKYVGGMPYNELLVKVKQAKKRLKK